MTIAAALPPEPLPAEPLAAAPLPAPPPADPTTQAPLPTSAPSIPPGAGPLWARLRDHLRDRVLAGDFDDAFPGELALAEQFGVSRHTVREALRELRADGTVTASRGRHPQLAAPDQIRQPLGALYSLFASVESQGHTQRSRVLTLDARRDPAAAARLELPEDAELVYLERIRLLDEAPLALDRVWLPAAVARPLLQLDFSRTSLYNQLWLACGVRLTGGSEEISAAVLSQEHRRLLACGADVAGLSIDRLGCSAQRPVEWRHTLIRADRFSLTARFTQHRYQFTPVESGVGAAAPEPVPDLAPDPVPAAAAETSA
ncbi:GntR family transcriptional regulator [Nakamurella aerolata]|uniref:GntR family transcriptional regulator n=1 Tax=Nakamurella aerolata TaxID=1656892 RepID=A0A849A7L1_9ACTN|nr:GntR family transcriptional regulator [Nakamurella aerolata]NNG35473.1 GntR family transcriptional regulator [Nakamurella aerolata]